MSRRHRQSPLVPIVFLLLVFGRSAFRFSYRTVRAIVRSVTSGVSINLHKLLEPSSIWFSTISVTGRRAGRRPRTRRLKSKRRSRPNPSVRRS